MFFSSFHNASHNKQSPSITLCFSREILIILYTYPTVSVIPSISLSPVHPLLPVFIWRPAVPEHLNPSSLPPLFMIPLFVLPCNLEDGRGSTCPWLVERNVWNLSKDILCLFTCYCSCVCVLVHVCVVPATTFGDVCLSPQTISAAVSQLVCATIFHCVQCHYQQASLRQLLLWNNYHFNKCTTKWIVEPCVCVCGGGCTYLRSQFFGSSAWSHREWMQTCLSPLQGWKQPITKKWILCTSLSKIEQLSGELLHIHMYTHIVSAQLYALWHVFPRRQDIPRNFSQHSYPP